MSISTLNNLDLLIIDLSDFNKGNSTFSNFALVSPWESWVILRCFCNITLSDYTSGNFIWVSSLGKARLNFLLGGPLFGFIKEPQPIGVK